MAATCAPDRGDPLIASARDALMARRFGRVRDVLQEGHGVGAEVVADGVASGPEVGAALNIWHADDPDDPNLRILLAARRLDALAWLALADGTDAEAVWLDGVESLWRAGELLQPLLGGSHDAAARVWLAAVAGGLAVRQQIPSGDFERCAADADRVSPTSVQVLRWRILTSDHSRDPAPGVLLAEEASASASRGDPRHAEVVSAHVERFLTLAEHDQQAGTDYWYRDHVRESLRTADERFADGDGGPASFDAHSLFAFALARTPDSGLARRHFQRLAGRLVTWPWTTMTDPIVAFEQLQDRAFARRSWLPGRRPRR